MKTSGLHILKTLCIFGLLAGIGIMEADSAVASTSVEQEVCDCVGLWGVLSVPARSRDSDIPRAISKAPGCSPDVSNSSSGHGGTFIPDEFCCGLSTSAHGGRFLMEMQKRVR